ncbi:DnaD domain protein [Chloroflexi bacterium TSY]|nr:DnaD domain protein [Chloroflexi bacterium TSY]
MNPVIIPDHFFSDLLPQIDELAELKLTLHCFWLLNEQSGDLRYLRGDDLRSDEKLLDSLTLDSDLRPPLMVLDDALQRAVARNTLLRLEIETDIVNEQMSTQESELVVETEDEREIASLYEADDQIDHDQNESTREIMTEDWYFMNTVKGRQTLAMIRQGRLHELLAVIPEEARLRVERPNIFVMYEQNISVMTPLIAEQLRDMEKTYPPSWLDEAFEIAVSRNARSLSYVQAILKRWESEGKENDHEITGRHSGSKQPAGQQSPGQKSPGQRKRRRSVLDEFSDIIIR